MAKMWFYTEPQFLLDQAAPSGIDNNALHESFGPWFNSGGQTLTDGFTVTNSFYSDHSVSPVDYQPKAFAVTSGTVVIIKQKRNDSTVIDFHECVNLILYPDEQPEGLPDIKCFIYRNIRIDSIADPAALSGPHPKIYDLTSPRSTDLGKAIMKSYTDFVAAGGTAQYPTIVDAGETLQNTLDLLEDDLEDYFLKNFDSSSIQHLNLPRVAAGDWIGSYNGYGITAGFEIIFDNANFNPILATVPGYPGSSSDIDGGRNTIRFNTSSSLELPHYQQAVNNYLDPAAFYGSQLNIGVMFKVIGNQASPNADPYPAPSFTVVEKSGITLYNYALKKFFNKDKVYVDIRDRWNMPYKFESYLTSAPDDLCLSFHDEGTTSPSPAPTPTKYRAELQWPLLRLHSSQFGNGAGYELNNMKILGIQFPSFTAASEAVGFYVDNSKLLLKSIPALEDGGADNSVLHNLGNDGAWTTRFLIGFPYVNDGSNNIVVSNYVKIRYIKHQKSYSSDYDDFMDPSAGVVGSSINLQLNLDTKDYLSPVFPVDMNLKWKNSPAINLRSTIYYEGLYFDNTAESGRDFFANIGIAQDAENKVTFFAYSTKAGSRKTKGLIDSTFSLASKNKKYDKSFLESLVEVDKFGTKMTYRSLTYTNVTPQVTVNDLRPANLSEAVIDEGRASHLDDFVSFEMTVAQYNQLMLFVQQARSFTMGNTIFLRFPSSADHRFKKNPRMFFHPVLVDRILETGKPALLVYEWTVVGFTPDLPIALTRLYTGVKTYRIEGKNRSIEKAEDQPKTEGIGFSLQGTNPIFIKSTIYLIRGGNVTPQELKAYMTYALNNIKKVWNTTNNRGLTAPNRVNIGDPAPLPLENISADLVEMKIAGPEQWKRLKKGEALWLVEKGQGRSRILGTANKNIGIMNFENTSVNPAVYTELTSNTPAHEFGHMLGLTDRYAYYTHLGTAGSVQINGNVGTTIPIYVNDSQYKDQYRWKNNLYSTQKIVNAAEFPSLTNYNTWMTGFPAQTIFITQQQWDIIEAVASGGMGNAESAEGSQYVYIFQTAAGYAGMNFTGMFGGLPVSDANFLNSTNPDQMEERILTANGANPPAGWVYPVINNLIDTNDRYALLKPRMGLSLDDDTPTTGLNAFIPASWKTQKAFIASANLALSPRIADDQHRGPGTSVIGDVFGYSIWNQRRAVAGKTGVEVYSTAAFQRFSHNITYASQYYNRILIMRLVVEGNLPTAFDL